MLKREIVPSYLSLRDSHGLHPGGKGGGQKEFNHVELRARVASHLEKHRQEYESEWDNILPNGTKAKSFDEYLAAIRQLKQFASELELRALSRIYNVRVLIVPASDAFTPMVFHTNAKRMLVLWLEDKHLEFLRTEQGRELHLARKLSGRVLEGPTRRSPSRA